MLFVVFLGRNLLPVPDLSEDLVLSLAKVVVSSGPRWRFARCLESERTDDEPKRGGVVHALESFFAQTNLILNGDDDFVEDLISRLKLH